MIPAPVDRRSTDVLTLPRAGVEEAWCDVQALAWETRRAVGRAYVDVSRARDPVPDLLDADRRLIHLTELARRNAGEAAGITFISPQQTSLWDGCLDGDDSERGA